MKGNQAVMALTPEDSLLGAGSASAFHPISTEHKMYEETLDSLLPQQIPSGWAEGCCMGLPVALIIWLAVSGDAFWGVSLNHNMRSLVQSSIWGQVHISLTSKPLISICQCPLMGIGSSWPSLFYLQVHKIGNVLFP